MAVSICSDTIEIYGIISFQQRLSVSQGQNSCYGKTNIDKSIRIYKKIEEKRYTFKKYGYIWPRIRILRQTPAAWTRLFLPGRPAFSNAGYATSGKPTHTVPSRDNPDGRHLN